MWYITMTGPVNKNKTVLEKKNKKVMEKKNYAKTRTSCRGEESSQKYMYEYIHIVLYIHF